jgi:hypothetical protein
MEDTPKRNGLLRRERVLALRLSRAAGLELDAICLEHRRTPSDLAAQIITDWLAQHAVSHGYHSEVTA